MAQASVRECSTELLAFSKMFLKISQIPLENTCTRQNLNVKVWLYACSLHPHYKRDSCTQLFSSEFRRIFESSVLLEHSWANALTYSSQKKYLKRDFHYLFSTEKVRQSKKDEEGPKLGNLRFAFQWNSLLLELHLLHAN